jgi:hypothetical protein
MYDNIKIMAMLDKEYAEEPKENHFKQRFLEKWKLVDKVTLRNRLQALGEFVNLNLKDNSYDSLAKSFVNCYDSLDMCGAIADDVLMTLSELSNLHKYLENQDSYNIHRIISEYKSLIVAVISEMKLLLESQDANSFINIDFSKIDGSEK